MRLVILPGLRAYQHCYTTALLKPREWLPTTITTQPPHGEQVSRTIRETRRRTSPWNLWVAWCYSCASSPCLPPRCVSLSDPAAISDTPRGRGPPPPQNEEKAKQEEPLSLFDLLPAQQAVRGGPDRHPGQCRLRGPKLWDSTLTRVPAKPSDSTASSTAYTHRHTHLSPPCSAPPASVSSQHISCNLSKFIFCVGSGKH